jgi:hypothetical protein
MQCARLGLEGSLPISIPAVHAPTAPSVAEASKGPFSARHVALATVQPTPPLQGQKTVYPVRDYLRINATGNESTCSGLFWDKFIHFMQSRQPIPQCV